MLSVWHISNRMCIYLYCDGYEGLLTQNGMWFNLRVSTINVSVKKATKTTGIGNGS